MFSDLFSYGKESGEYLGQIKKKNGSTGFTSFRETAGSINILEWRKEYRTRIWTIAGDLFFLVVNTV